ncbi:arginine--tRNA ligase [Paenibacillus oryzisoli]|uniref:arginine--tRNA ligase n=1 Tax=Paenibacillus oryzisoli TaxID=1850517 RepID=UPI003D2BD608
MISAAISMSIDRCTKSLFSDLGLPCPADLTIAIEQPAQLEHGDYATNIAMQLAKLLRKAPLHIAEALKGTLEADAELMKVIQRVEVAAPGFLNLWVDWGRWAAAEIGGEAGAGAASRPSQNGKVVIEHTSINPNKSAHIGHLRNSCIGDTLARLLRRTGYQVEVHNYIDDLGNQLADTVVGLQQVQLDGEHARFGDFCWDTYAAVNKAYGENPALLEERTRVLHALEEGGGNVAWLGLLVAERIVREHLAEMRAFGITYDLLVWESRIVREGFWQAAFDLLRQTPQFALETDGKLAGCWVLRETEAGAADAGAVEKAEGTDSAGDAYHKDKVLVRSNGILTYTAKDIAYHLWKFGVLGKDFRYQPFEAEVWSTQPTGESAPFGQADMVINVIDHRQAYPQAMVKQALAVLGYAAQAELLRHVGYGVVSLSPGAAQELGLDTSAGKASYAMSGRQGIGIKVAELLDRMERVIDAKRSDHEGLASRDIAAAAIRYYLLRFSLLTEVVFDIAQATEVTGNSGVYLMYAHARAASILGKAGVVEPLAAPAFAEPEKAEHALLKQLADWPDRLAAAARELTPHTLCNYAHELAVLFNNFYGACPILKADAESKAQRLWLTAKFQATMADALSVLGLPAPSRM